MSVYDVVLLPSSRVSKRSEAISQDLSKRHNTEFTLETGKIESHLSLYMAELNWIDLWRAKRQLKKIATQNTPLPLTASHYGHNFSEGMFEAFYQKTPQLSKLQAQILEQVSPLRSRRWPEQNPVGKVLDEWTPRQTGILRQNLEKYGYEEVEDLFKPHITFTRFTNRSEETDLQKLSPITDLNDTFSTLALYKMGKHGTCIEPVKSYQLQHSQQADSIISKLKQRVQTLLPKSMNQTNLFSETMA